jgi:hypothetical protein
VNTAFSPADRKILRDALCAVPQFLTPRDRNTLIRLILEGHAFSRHVDTFLSWVDWNGGAVPVADELLRLLEGHEIAPGTPALRVLAEAMEPMAGMAHRQEIVRIRERLGWVTHSPGYSFPQTGEIVAKRERGEYDVFLCHNSKEKSEVIAIGDRLIQRGLLPWLDRDVLRPGLRWLPEIERQILSIPSAAVLVGGSGIGPWQDEEIDAILRTFKKQNRPVIPVMLEGAPEIELPPFLDGRTRVDFRKNQPDPMDQLVFGITGKNPRFASTS